MSSTRRRLSRLLLVASAVTVTSVVSASSAFAAATVDAFPSTYTGGAENNNVTVSYDSGTGRIVFTDPNSGGIADNSGGTCIIVSPTQATCPFDDVNVFGNDGNDTITFDPTLPGFGFVFYNANGGAGDDTLNGTGNDETLLGGDGTDALNGGAGDDILDGGTGSDNISGGDGDEDLVTYAGRAGAVTVNLTDPAAGSAEAGGEGEAGENDTVRSDVENVEGGNGADTLTGNTRSNELDGNDGNDTIDGGPDDAAAFNDDDEIFGGAGNDSLQGGNGNDAIDGGSGDDSILGEDGSDDISGGLFIIPGPGITDNDTIDAGNGDDGFGASGFFLFGVNGDAGNDTVNGGAGDDFFLGGGSGDDTVNGGSGNDDINGGSGTDVMNGDSGNDDVDDGDFAVAPPDTTQINADTADGGTGSDRISYAGRSAPVTVNLAQEAGNGEAGENDTLRNFEEATGTSDDGTTTGTGDDTLTGNAEDNILDGLSGDDTLVGADGDDQLNGGVGFDNLDGGEGEDGLSGGDQNDVLTGGNGDDGLSGGEGDDSLSAGAGEDGLDGGLGSDTIDGGDGGEDTASYFGRDEPVAADLEGDRDDGEAGENDQILNVENLNGGDSDDVLVGNDGANTINGTSGRDAIAGAGGNDELFGSDGRDTVAGGAGNDRVNGGGARDVLAGDAGKDRLDGGAQGDVMNGGDDEDIAWYRFRSEAVRVTIGNGAADDGAFGVEGDNVGGDVENVVGGEGDDVLTGNDGPNTLIGGPAQENEGDDTLIGGGGADHLVGYAMDDTLDGGAGDDDIDAGTGGDSVTGGRGDDTVDTRDNRRDTVNCGGGQDQLRADKRDTGRACEIIATGKGPQVRLRTKKAKVDRGGEFLVKLTCPRTAGVCTGTLEVVKGKNSLATAAFSVKAGKTETVEMSLTDAGEKALNRKRRVKASLQAAAQNAAGEAALKSRKITLIRSGGRISD